MNVAVKNSPISGKGLYALKDFKKGEKVLQWNPKILSEKEYQNLTEEEMERTTFLDGKYLLMNSPERFINHSCNPNTLPGDRCDIASRNIVAGEEITSDYALSAPKGWSMVCRCENKNCRKIIRNS